MSISSSLRRAAKIQEKIEGLRNELTQLLDRARSEASANLQEEMPSALRRPGRPKMFKSNGRRPYRKAAPAVVKGKLKETAKPKAKAVVPRGGVRRKRSPLLGVKRASSPSGPLAPAVVKVLKSTNKPMQVRHIFDGLTSNGYKFTSAEPKKNLAARIYRLRGVKQVSAGLFAAI